MIIKIWTKEGCTRCTKVIEALRKEFIDAEIVEYDIENITFELRSMVQVELAMQNMELPVVFYGGKFVNPDKIVGKSCDVVCRAWEGKANANSTKETQAD